MLKTILITALLSLATVSILAQTTSEKNTIMTQSEQPTNSFQPCTPYPMCKIWEVKSQTMEGQSSGTVQLTHEKKVRQEDMKNR